MRVKIYRSDKDMVWLECTIAEAEMHIHPLLTNEQIVQSRNMIEEEQRQWLFGDEEDNSTHPHDVYEKKVIKYPACFNASRDLSRIEPAPVNLPFSPMWNAYNPYELIRERFFTDISDLKDQLKTKPLDT